MSVSAALRMPGPKALLAVGKATFAVVGKGGAAGTINVLAGIFPIATGKPRYCRRGKPEEQANQIIRCSGSLGSSACSLLGPFVDGEITGYGLADLEPQTALAAVTLGQSRVLGNFGQPLGIVRIASR